jgi:hypothetical protein
MSNQTPPIPSAEELKSMMEAHNQAMSQKANPTTPAAVKDDGLTADEVHELRRIIENSRLVQGEKERSAATVNDLPIEEDDKNRFCDFMLQGEPYTEALERMGGKIKVEFRSRTRAEEEEIIRQIQKDFEENLLKTDSLYVNRLNLYNLVTQTVSLDGIKLNIDTSIPLRERSDKSIFGNMSEPKIYVLSCLLVQFEGKLSRLCRMAVDPGFSKPATDS